MSFLAPLFLLGLAAVAIPVIIHLTHRERREPFVFPSLMFLRTIPFRTQRRQRLRNWLLFAMRVTAVVLVVAAFARPLLTGRQSAAASLGRARDVVILLDRSYSMGYGDHWQRAVSAAARAIDGIGADDRASLILFDDQAEAVTRVTGDRSALHAALNAATVGAGATRYTPPLALARDLLAQSDRPRREVVLISDFQRNGWDAHSDVHLPAGVTLTPVDVSGVTPEDLAVTGVLLDRSDASGRLAVTARIAGHSSDAVTNAQVVLEIDGKEVRRTAVAVPNNGSAVAQFPPVPVPPHVALGRVRLAKADQLPQDDAFQFLVAPPAVINVLLIESGAAASEGRYLRRALAVGRDPAFHVTTARAQTLAAADLSGHELAIVDDATLSAAGADLLHRFAARGGGVLFILGADASGRALAGAFGDLFARESFTTVDRLNDRGGVVSIVDYHHPALQEFASPRSGDFSAARFFRYRRVDLTAAASVLMRYDDGATALAEVTPDSGRVMVWTSDLGTAWNDLPVKPVFLPFLHQIVRHLARYVPAPAWRTVGAALDLEEVPAAHKPGGTLEAEVVVETPAGRRSSRHPGSPDGHVRLDEAGFYRVRPLDNSREGSVIAVNPDVNEADLSRIEPDVVVAAVVTGGSARPTADQSTDVTAPDQLERRQGLWWYLLGAALVLLAAETLVARRTEPLVRLSA